MTTTQTALALPGVESNVPTLAEISGTRLWRACSRADDKSTWVAHRIVESEELFAQARAYSGHLETLCQSVGDGQQARALKLEAMGPLVALCGRPNFAGPNLEHWWDNWHEALQTLPLVAIREAVRTYVSTTEDTRWPAPGKIVKLANEVATTLRTLQGRVKMAMLLPAPKPKPSEAEQAEMREKLRGLSAEIRARSAAGIGAQPRPTRSPQEVARELRAMADRSTVRA